MAYNPYASFGMQSLYRPRQVLNPYATPGMAQQPQINPGRPPSIKDLLEAYKQYQDASAAVEAHHAANAGGTSSGSGVLGGGAAGAGGYWALSGGEAGATAAPALELGASAPEMMLPELTGSSVGTVSSGGGAAGAGAGASGASSSGGYAAMTGGPGSFGYWAGPAAFMATAPIWAPQVSKYGEKAGEGFMKATGLKKKRYDRPYSAESAATSTVINRQLPGLNKADKGKQAQILDKFKEAKAMIVPGATTPDFSKAESTPDRASRVGISSAYLTDMERNKLKSKYGKNYNFAAIKPEDLANILSPIGRNKKGMERLVSFNDAVKAYKGLGG